MMIILFKVLIRLNIFENVLIILLKDKKFLSNSFKDLSELMR